MKKIIILSSIIIFSLSAQKTSLDLLDQCEQSCLIQHQPCKADSNNSQTQSCQNRLKQYNICLQNCNIFYARLNQCQMSAGRTVNVINEIVTAQNEARQIGKFRCWPYFISKNLNSLFLQPAKYDCVGLSIYINFIKPHVNECYK